MLPHTISQDLRAWIPTLHYRGYKPKEICDLLGVGKSLVYKTLQYHQIYGLTYNPHAQLAARRRILTSLDVGFIRLLLLHHHTLYLDELQLELQVQRNVFVSLTTIMRTLRRLHFSNKRVSVQALERNDLQRAIFMNQIGAAVPDPAMLMFTDESAMNNRAHSRRYGWSLVGTRCVQRQAFVRGQRYSILPVLTLDGIIAFDLIEGSVTGERFVRFLREMVVCFFFHVLYCTNADAFIQIPLTNPYPGPRSVLVLDNCNIHHAEEVRELVEVEAGKVFFFM
jgi:transposase